MILTISDFKGFLGIATADTSGDTQLTSVLQSAYAEAENRIGRSTLDYSATAVVEYHDDPRGRAIKTIYSKLIPIVSVTSLYINETLLAVDSDYYLDNNALGVITLESEHNIQDARAVKLTYTAGYSTATFPADLRMAIFSIAINEMRRARISTTQADSQIVLYNRDDITRILTKYSRVTI